VRQRGIVRLGTIALVLAVPALLVSAESASADDSSGSATVTLPFDATTRPPATPESMSKLRAAAVAWAKAFLSGSARQFRSLQGPECVSTTRTTLPLPAVAAYLHGLRVLMSKQVGTPVGRIEIRDVELRNVTANRGEAQVVYDLPISKAGNDNWVEFTVHRGRWMVSDCKAPIFGHSSSANASSPNG
jgi:hypothetical protein